MKSFILLFVVFFFAVGCRKEIDVDLNDANPKMIIEANYNATDSVVQVCISTTSSYFDAFQVNYINDAVVTIQDENGSPIVIPFTSDGLYILSNYPPTEGSNYTITVTHNGVDYTSSSQLMPAMELLPSTVAFQEASFFADEGYWITYRFQDPVGLGNCYKLIATYGGKRYDRYDEFAKGNDKLTDGNLVERPLIEPFQIGDTVILELQSVNQKIVEYYNQLSSSSSGFNAAVGNPDYLWTNNALGYFSAYGYSLDTVVVTE